MKRNISTISALILLSILGVAWQPALAQVPHRDGIINYTRTASGNALQTAQWVPFNNTTGNPTGRHETSFVMAGGKFYLMAGREAADIDIFDPATGAWRDGASIPNVASSRMHHFQPVVIDGLVFAVAAYTGNCCGNGEIGATNIYIYDPVLDLWLTGPTIPQNRRRGSTGVVRSGDLLYIAGGLQFGHGSTGTISYDFFDSYNPFTNEWAVLPDMPRSRDHFGAAIVGDKIYAAGGRNTGEGNPTQGTVIAEVDVFDISDNQWTTLPSASNIPTSRGGTATAVLGNDIYVIGGEESSVGIAFDETEALNATTEQWTSLANLNQERHGTTTAVCNGTIWIAGGSPFRGGGQLVDIERYHPSGTPTDCTEPEITPSTLTPSSGAFGTLSPGGSGSLTVTISNGGGSQATYIDGIALQNNTGSVFQITDSPSDGIIVGANTSITVNVQFTSAGEGAATADLVLTTPQKGSNLVVPLTAFTTGDIDRDDNGFIGPSDVLFVMNRVGGNDLLADVNTDGSVTLADVEIVLNQLGQPFSD
ncbi:MAG: kelch repeat-containing protein [Chloroflexota bacterium]